MKRILLIGGHTGLGAAIQRELFEDKVKAVSRRSERPLDLRWTAEAIKERTLEFIDELEGLDALIVSSGMGAYLGPLASMEKIEDLVKVNQLGPIAVYKACQKALLKSKGKACFITSTCSRRPGSGGLSIYGSTKAAINSFVVNEGRRAAKKGVALFSVSPGWFESDMTAELEPKARASAEKGIPFGRFGTAEEIAQFTVSLLDQTNWCLAGQVFEVSGGA